MAISCTQGKWSDDELVPLMVGVQQRCQVAFRRLIKTTEPVLRAQIRRHQWNSSLADDTLQETYVSVWDHADQFDATRGSAAGWLKAIARNKAISAFRQAHATVEWQAEAFDTDDEAVDHGRYAARTSLPPCELLTHRHEAEALRRHVRALQPKQREAVTLAFYGELCHAEVAARMNKPLGSIKSDIRRGLLALRGRMDARAKGAKAGTVDAAPGCGSGAFVA
jgi:RNA polymerase sigma-70 factor (ECF subfamily)